MITCKIRYSDMDRIYLFIFISIFFMNIYMNTILIKCLNLSLYLDKFEYKIEFDRILFILLHPY